ncbi:MAG TPA: hypothetical protein VKM93_19675 [Terriglobia bacterium]|nr:hypothetical protein [Terriglobia bacterium]
MPDFLSEPMVEIARRLDIRGPNPWLAVLGPPTDSTVALDELQTELHSFLEIPTRVFPLETATFERLREALQQPDDDAVVLTAGADLAPEKWSSLDVMRSALERVGPIVLWMPPEAVASLAEFAPNIRSFIGASIFMAAPDGGIMTEMERQKRLAELAEHYGLSSEEIVRRAESKEPKPTGRAAVSPASGTRSRPHTVLTASPLRNSRSNFLRAGDGSMKPISGLVPTYLLLARFSHDVLEVIGDNLTAL